MKRQPALVPLSREPHSAFVLAKGAHLEQVSGGSMR